MLVIISPTTTKARGCSPISTVLSPVPSIEEKVEGPMVVALLKQIRTNQHSLLPTNTRWIRPSVEFVPRIRNYPNVLREAVSSLSKPNEMELGAVVEAAPVLSVRMAPRPSLLILLEMGNASLLG